jgi:hypothetical protein
MHRLISEDEYNQQITRIKEIIKGDLSGRNIIP